MNAVDKKKRLCKELILLFLMALLIEIFVFNMRSFDTAFNFEKAFDSSYDVEIYGGYIDSNGDIVMEEDEVSLYITGFDYPLKNIRLDVECMEDEISPYIPDHVCTAEISAFDDALFEQIDEDGGSYLTDAATAVVSQDIFHGVESSYYIYLVPFGNINKLEMILSPASGVPQRLRLHELTFNAVRPLNFAPIRIIGVFLILILIYFSLINPVLWKEDCVTPKAWKKILIVVMMLLFSVFTLVLMLSNKALLVDDFSPYGLLARALSEGKTYVGEAGELIKQTDGRAVFWREDSTIVMFDYALFEGKYYVYFGLLPCLIFYLPYYLITGGDLPNIIPEMLMRVVTVALIGRLLLTFIHKYYRKTSFALFLLMWGAVIGAMYVPAMIAGMAIFYEIPIFCGVSFVFGGLCFILESDKEPGRISIFKLAMGCSCFSAVSLCRPNLLLYGFIIMAYYIWNRRMLIKAMESKQKAAFALAVTVPYIVFASVCMTYNCLRFGSVFDFGAAYNATAYPIRYASLFLPFVTVRAVYDYLLRPPFIDFGFPFTDYMTMEQMIGSGSTMLEDVFLGGVIASNPFTWLLVTTGHFRKSLKEKKLILPMALCGVAAFVLMIYSVYFTSSLYARYTLEFSPVILIAAVFIVMELYERILLVTDKLLKKILLMGLASMLLISVFWGIVQFGCGEVDGWPLLCGNTELWYRVYNGLRVF